MTKGNTTAYIQHLRETDPRAFGRGGVGSEAESLFRVDLDDRGYAQKKGGYEFVRELREALLGEGRRGERI